MLPTEIVTRCIGGVLIILVLIKVIKKLEFKNGNLIPDFIPVLGYIDDIILLPALVALTMRMIPADVLDVGRKEAAELWLDGNPKSGIARCRLWFCGFLLQ